MVHFMENSNLKWMMTRGTLILGNHHIRQLMQSVKAVVMLFQLTITWLLARNHIEVLIYQLNYHVIHNLRSLRSQILSHNHHNQIWQLNISELICYLISHYIGILEP